MIKFSELLLRTESVEIVFKVCIYQSGIHDINFRLKISLVYSTHLFWWMILIRIALLDIVINGFVSAGIYCSLEQGYTNAIRNFNYLTLLCINENHFLLIYNSFFLLLAPVHEIRNALKFAGTVLGNFSILFPATFCYIFFLYKNKAGADSNRKQICIKDFVNMKWIYRFPI